MKGSEWLHVVMNGQLHVKNTSLLVQSYVVLTFEILFVEARRLFNIFMLRQSLSQHQSGSFSLKIFSLKMCSFKTKQRQLVYTSIQYLTIDSVLESNSINI